MLTVYHSNRLEILAQGLAQAMQDNPGDSALRPRDIIVPHPSMGRWLQLELAERTGIAANLRFPLPAQFIAQLFGDLFPEPPPQLGFDQGVMSWRLFALLDARRLDADPVYAPVRDYLAGTGNDQALKRYQLASQLAALYDRYLCYRPDWTCAWQQSEGLLDGPGSTAEAWQAALWRELQASEAAHWGELLRRFEQEPELLDTAAARLDGPAYLFGLTSLPPAHMDVFRRLAERVTVELYFPSPNKAWATDRGVHRAPDAATAEEHPLLASMGAAGRDFLRLLQRHGQAQPVSHFSDAQPPETLLQALQSDLAAPTRQITLPAAPDDGSISINSCHSRLREVQVLHDQLLAMLEETEGLRPRHIVVMAPNIGDYAPYIEAVFERPDKARRIPYTVADRAARQQHPIFGAFWDLLNLPLSRWSAAEVLDLLRVPAISRCFGIAEADHARLHDWVEASGIRWGIDEEFRDGLNAGRFRQNSWAFGLDRLLMGYAVSDEDVVIDGIRPLPHAEGNDAELLGKLASFLECLQAIDGQLRGPHPAAHWRAVLLELLETLFAAPSARSSDAQVREAARLEAGALQMLRSMLHEFATGAASAEYGEPLPWQVVRAHLEAQLEQVGANQPYLDRGVTFCSLSSLRNLPFAAVCLLGMNSDDFPRQDRPAAFDLIAAQPRPGDRSPRADDRYLFLESLLAARRRLYISYVGRDIKNNSQREPAVVVSELLDLLTTEYGADRDALVTEHRLHPFSAAYFDGSSSLFSYAQEWVAGGAEQQLKPFLSADALPPPDEEWRKVELTQLTRFFANPMQYLMEQRLAVRLDKSEGIADEEPQAVGRLDRYLLCKEVVEAALAGETIQEEPSALMVAAGRLPPGLVGKREYQKEVCAPATKLHKKLNVLAHPEQRQEPITFSDLAFALEDGTRLTLSGSLTDVYAEGLVHWRPGKLRAEHRLKLWIEHLALHVATSRSWQSRLVGNPTKTKVDTLVLRQLEAQEARQRLQDLLQVYWDGLHGLREALWLFPDCYSAYRESVASSGEEEALAEAHKKFSKDYYSGMKNRYVERFTRGIDNPLDDTFVKLARRVIEPMLNAKEA